MATCFFGWSTAVNLRNADKQEKVMASKNFAEAKNWMSIFCEVKNW